MEIFERAKDMKKFVLCVSMAVLFFQVGNSSGNEGTMNEQIITDELKKQFSTSAVKVADWLVHNQVTNGYDANHGRFIATVDVTKPDGTTFASDWMIGAASMGLLMMYHRSGDEKYLEAAKRAGQYLLTLQIVDPRNPRFYGAFREDTPQSTWCHPRDGLTAAWALLWLYQETGDERYLDSVKLFNRWFTHEAMDRGWPAWSFYFNERQPDYLQGSFHGGDAAYFFDYYRVTGDATYNERGMKFILDYAMEKFIMPDGRVRVIYDADTGNYIEDGKTFDGMQKMHRHNDDFMSISLLDGYCMYKDSRYLKRAEAYARWLISEQREDGGFGTPDVPPAAATAPNFLVDLYMITKKEEYLKAAVKAGTYLVTQQELSKENEKVYGGFYGYGPGWESGKRTTLNIRTSAYALIALLKLEGKEQGPYYSPFDRDGSPGIKP